MVEGNEKMRRPGRVGCSTVRGGNDRLIEPHDDSVVVSSKHAI